MTQDIERAGMMSAGAGTGFARLTAGQLITESVNLLDRGFTGSWPVWLALAVILVATDLVMLVYGAAGANEVTTAQTVALAVRSVAMLWVFVSGLRSTILGHASWKLDRGFWSGVARLALVQTIILSATGAVLTVIALRIDAAVADPHAARTTIIASGAALAVAIIPLEIKSSPWPDAALAGERGLTLVGAWRRTRGTTWPAIIAWIVLVLPFMLVHFALSAWIEQSTAADNVRITLIVVDCLVSVLETALMIGVMAAFYVLTRERGAGPARR